MSLTFFDPTSLFAGGKTPNSRAITIAQAGALVRGTLLGRKSVGAVSSAAKSGGNTGTGTFVLDATTPALANAAPGVYTLRATAAGTNLATFRLTDPKGTVLSDYSFNGSGATVTVGDRIKGVITDGGTDFVVGDGFDITIAAVDKYIASVATAIDGSQIPSAILAADVDTTSADVVAPAYFDGVFGFEVMTINSSWTITTLAATLRQNNIPLYIKTLGTLD